MFLRWFAASKLAGRDVKFSKEAKRVLWFALASLVLVGLLFGTSSPLHI